LQDGIIVLVLLPVTSHDIFYAFTKFSFGELDISLTVTVLENIKEGLSYQSLHWAHIRKVEPWVFSVWDFVVEENVY